MSNASLPNPLPSAISATTVAPVAPQPPANAISPTSQQQPPPASPVKQPLPPSVVSAPPPGFSSLLLAGANYENKKKSPWPDKGRSYFCLV